MSIFSPKKKYPTDAVAATVPSRVQPPVKKVNRAKKQRFAIYLGIGKEKEFLIENLSFLISSGIPVAQALYSIEEELKSKFMKRVIRTAREDIENGVPLSRALEDTALFGSHAISLIRSGEESGTLSQNLTVVAEQDAKNRLFKSKLKSALMYPALVLGVTGLVGLGVSWFILPKLAIVFSQLKIKLPLITKLLIEFGAFLNDWGAIALPIAIAILILIFYFLFYFPGTRSIGQKFLFAIPGVRRLIQELEIARLGYLLGTLTKAGLPLLQSLESLRESTLSPFYQKFYAYLQDSIEKGISFDRSFREYKKMREILPASIQQIIVTGEQSGNLSTALLRVGTTYEEKVEITSKNLSIALEPILLVVVWVGVVLVALAVILPIYSLIGGINK